MKQKDKPSSISLSQGLKTLLKDKSGEGIHLYQWQVDGMSLNEENQGSQKSDFLSSTISCQRTSAFKIIYLGFSGSWSLCGAYLCMHVCENKCTCVPECACMHVHLYWQTSLRESAACPSPIKIEHAQTRTAVPISPPIFFPFSVDSEGLRP